MHPLEMAARVVSVMIGCACAGMALAGCGGGGGQATAACTGKRPKLSLDMRVRRAGAHVWRRSITARPGEKLEYRVELSNYGLARALHTRVRVRLSQGEQRVLASVYSQPLGVPVSNGNPVSPVLFGRGISLGPFPGCGSVTAILYDTRAGRRSYGEQGVVTWTGGWLRRSVPVTVVGSGA